MLLYILATRLDFLRIPSRIPWSDRPLSVPTFLSRDFLIMVKAGVDTALLISRLSVTMYQTGKIWLFSEIYWSQISYESYLVGINRLGALGSTWLDTLLVHRYHSTPTWCAAVLSQRIAYHSFFHHLKRSANQMRN